MKKFKKLLMLVVTLAIAASFTIGGLGFGALASNGVSVGTTAIQATGTVGVEIGNIPNTCTVLDPKGKDVTVTSGKFTPTQAGTYFVNFKDGDDTYKSFRIKVTAENAKIVLPFGGAEIPTAMGLDKSVKLPAPKVIVTDEDGEEVDKTSDYTIVVTLYKIDGSTQVLTADATDKLYEFKTDAAKAGTYTVRYTASKGNYITLMESYTINAQKDFTDEDKPTLTVSGVPTDRNINTKVSLPTATATDNYDTNVKIEVTVKDSDGNPVKDVDDSDEKNIVVKDTEVAFENGKTMSFYPQKEGKFTVEYKATDDNSNVAKTAYVIEVKDKQYPTIEVKSEVIPTTWGLTVKKDDTKLTGNTAAIKIPFATAWDNVKLEDDVKVDVSIKDPSGKVFFNTAVDSLKVHANVTEDANAKCYYFNVAAYDPASGSSSVGEYVIAYKVRDKNKQETTKNVYVKVQDEFVDSFAPTVEVETIQDTLFEGEFFKEPVFSIYDKDNANVIVDKTYEFTKAGETDAVAFTDEQMRKLEKDGKLKMAEAGTITVTVVAQDQVGYTSAEKKHTVEVIDGMTGDTVTTDYVNVVDTLTGVEANKSFDLVKENSVFTISTSTVTNHLGFEVNVTEKVGEVERDVKSTVSYVYKSEASATKIEISSLKFMPTTTAEYSVTIRAFERGGVSVLKTFKVSAVKTGETNPPSPNDQRAAVLPTTMKLGETQKLPTFTEDGVNLYTRISGSGYQVMGKSFMPKATGDYSFAFYTVTGGNPSSETKDTLSVVNPDAPTFALLQDYVPYAPKLDTTSDAYKKDLADLSTTALYQKYYVQIPDVSVMSDSGNAIDVQVEVTDKKGDKVNTLEDNSISYFMPTVDGVYTITYTATDKLNASVEKTIKISVGDIEMPTIAGIDTPASTYKQNTKIKLSKITVSDNKSESGKITVTKLIIGPDGATLHTETSKGASGTEYTLDKAGTYIVRYTAKDEAGNEAKVDYKVTVTGKTSTGVSYQVISTVLIIVAVLLIVGLIIYFFAFRKIDGDKINHKKS